MQSFVQNMWNYFFFYKCLSNNTNRSIHLSLGLYTNTFTRMEREINIELYHRLASQWIVMKLLTAFSLMSITYFCGWSNAASEIHLSVQANISIKITDALRLLHPSSTLNTAYLFTYHGTPMILFSTQWDTIESWSHFWVISVRFVETDLGEGGVEESDSHSSLAYPGLSLSRLVSHEASRESLG